MIVLDASAAVAALLIRGPAREILTNESVHAPHLIDSEVASTLRRRALAHPTQTASWWELLDVWSQLGLVRYPTYPMLERIWSLRDNLSAYDANYVALAELLGCALVTADTRLARAPGIRCAVTCVPG